MIPALFQREERAFQNGSLDHSETARRLLKRRPTGILGKTTSETEKQMVRKANIRFIIFPWMNSYKLWWSFTAIAAILTAFFVPYHIAFQSEPGSFNDAAAVIQLCLNAIFMIDIAVNCNLAFYDSEIMIFERVEILKSYFQGMFWVDLVGVFPFETVILLHAWKLSQNPKDTLLLSLVYLVRFVRLHRLQKLSNMLQYSARISLLWFTLIRNCAAVLLTTHLAACTMYFLARFHSFDETTWIGPRVDGLSGIQRYVVSLYWSTVTFCTVGYGDFSPANTSEQICGIIFMLINIVVAAWIIGSITLLVVKGDEKTGEYRDSLQTLRQYSKMHDFDECFFGSLKTQLRLDFHNREISDEQVLKNFPSAVRRKILRRLYFQPLMNTKLMQGIRQQFVDAFLASCKVEIFSPGEVIVERGSILSDLFLLVGGIAEITTHDHAIGMDDHDIDVENEHFNSAKLEAGDFVGEIGFFTESPQVDSVACLTVCKTLTISQSAYKLLAQDHPGSAGKILDNLLAKVEEEERELMLPKPLVVLRAGSSFDFEGGYGSLTRDQRYHESYSRKEALSSIKDLVKMHMSKQLDDNTTRFCFAASRGDTATIALMCDQGFDPNSADYDHRNALMVASMKGNTEVVKMLLEYNVSAMTLRFATRALYNFRSSLLWQANPNLSDMHGSTALLEAVKNGHESTMGLLLRNKAQLCMPDSLAASVLCQAVFDGDTPFLKRLLQAGINVNASDYDKRTAAHIAAAEGNVAAIKVLADHGADLTLEDRWKNTVLQEAERSSARQLLEYLQQRICNGTPGMPSSPQRGRVDNPMSSFE